MRRVSAPSFSAPKHFAMADQPSAGHITCYGQTIKDASDVRAVPEHNLIALKTYVDSVKVHLDLALEKVSLPLRASLSTLVCIF